MRFPWVIINRRKLEAEIGRLRQEHADVVEQVREFGNRKVEVALAQQREGHARELETVRAEEQERARLEIAAELAHHQREHRRWLEHAAAKGDFNASAILGGSA